MKAEPFFFSFIWRSHYTLHSLSFNCSFKEINTFIDQRWQ